MNALSTITAAPRPLTSADRADELATAHLTALASLRTLTSADWLHARGDRLVKRVRFLAKHGNAGMLGANGIGPEIDALMRDAKLAGFSWRVRGQ